MLSENEVMQEIRAWHEADRRNALTSTFQLGDLILKAVIHTGKSSYEVIRRIIADLGDLAMGETTYNRAARMAKVFTANQRRVLVDKLVSLEKAEILAGEQYEGRRRVKIINEIKSGKIKSPWKTIRSIREKVREEIIAAVVSGNEPRQSWDNLSVPIVVNGTVDELAVKNAVKIIMARLGKMQAVALIAAAVKEYEENEEKK